jgi:hypothetical protein
MGGEGCGVKEFSLTLSGSLPHTKSKKGHLRKSENSRFG